MRKIALTLFVTGITMTAYGAEVDDKPHRDGGRQPLAPLSGHSNTSAEELYPDYSHYINAERETARRKGVERGREIGREEERLKNVQRMLAKGLPDSDINELADLKDGELDKIKEQLKGIK